MWEPIAASLSYFFPVFSSWLVTFVFDRPVIIFPVTTMCQCCADWCFYVCATSRNNDAVLNFTLRLTWNLLMLTSLNSNEYKAWTCQPFPQHIWFPQSDITVMNKVTSFCGIILIFAVETDHLWFARPHVAFTVTSRFFPTARHILQLFPTDLPQRCKPPL